jgi:hypothetical protein
MRDRKKAADIINETTLRILTTLFGRINAPISFSQKSRLNATDKNRLPPEGAAGTLKSCVCRCLGIEYSMTSDSGLGTGIAERIMGKNEENNRITDPFIVFSGEYPVDSVGSER